MCFIFVFQEVLSNVLVLAPPPPPSVSLTESASLHIHAPSRPSSIAPGQQPIPARAHAAQMESTCT